MNCKMLIFYQGFAFTFIHHANRIKECKSVWFTNINYVSIKGISKGISIRNVQVHMYDFNLVTSI